MAENDNNVVKLVPDCWGNSEAEIHAMLDRAKEHASQYGYPKVLVVFLDDRGDKYDTHILANMCYSDGVLLSAFTQHDFMHKMRDV